KSYHWQEVRPRSNQNTKDVDKRINPFGIGGEAEARAGLLVSRQLILGPTVHFGLGENSQAQTVRFAWANGTGQAEFELASNAPVMTPQRLIGSCPWLFAWDGQSMQFVTDILWKSPLGLRINAQDTAGVSQTRDWVKVRGDQLQARDGFYD